MRLPHFTPRQLLIVTHDLLATVAALALTLLMRFEDEPLAQRLPWLATILPVFRGLRRRSSFCSSVCIAPSGASLRCPTSSDPPGLGGARASFCWWLTTSCCRRSYYGAFFFGKITILLYWFLEMAFLSGSRIAYRYFRYTRTLQHCQGVGASSGACGRPRRRRRGAVACHRERRRHQGLAGRHPVAVVGDRGQTIRGVSVLGDIDDLERVVADLETRGTRIIRVILTPSALEQEAKPEATLIRARRLNIATSQLPALDAGGQAVQLAPVAVEDLLLRPTVASTTSGWRHSCRASRSLSPAAAARSAPNL